MTMNEVAIAQQWLASNPSNRGFNGSSKVSQAIQKQQGNGGMVMGNHSFADSPLTSPWVVMPDGGFPFSNGAAVATPAVSATVWTDILNFSVPNGFDGIINNISNFYNGAGYVNGSGQLVWRILLNGQAVRNYDNIIIQLGSNGTNQTQIRVSSNDLVQFQVTNASLVGAATQVFAFMGGWYYPNKQTGGN